jgi:hypothetical protein
MKVTCNLDNNLYFKAKEVGAWWGTCTCPDGATYDVGDNNDGCGSLACHGGTAGTCNQNGDNRGAVGMKVICGQGSENKVYKGIKTVPAYLRIPGYSAWEFTGSAFQTGEFWDSWVRLEFSSNSRQVMTGTMLANSDRRRYINRVDYLTIPNSADGTECVEVNWDFWNKEWNECPQGYWLTGFYRQDPRWVDHMRYASCCRTKEMPKVWGTCVDAYWHSPHDEGSTWAHCPKEHALVGFHKYNYGRHWDARPISLDYGKCCRFPEMVLYTQPHNVPDGCDASEFE